MEDWKQGVVFMRHTDKRGSSYVDEHSCWNTDKFIEVRRKAAEDEGGSVEVVTQEVYKESKRGRTN